MSCWQLAAASMCTHNFKSPPRDLPVFIYFLSTQAKWNGWSHGRDRCARSARCARVSEYVGMGRTGGCMRHHHRDSLLIPPAPSPKVPLCWRSVNGTNGAAGPQGPAGTIAVNGSTASDYLYWDATTSAWTVGSTTVKLGANAVASGQYALALGSSGTSSLSPSPRPQPSQATTHMFHKHSPQTTSLASSVASQSVAVGYLSAVRPLPPFSFPLATFRRGLTAPFFSFPFGLLPPPTQALGDNAVALGPVGTKKPVEWVGEWVDEGLVGHELIFSPLYFALLQPQPGHKECMAYRLGHTRFARETTAWFWVVKAKSIQMGCPWVLTSLILLQIPSSSTATGHGL